MMGNVDDLMNLVRREVARHLDARIGKRYGLVTSYDPDRHLAKVALQPHGQETGWLPIRTPSAGNGFGISIGLTEGTQVELVPQDDDLNALAISGMVHSDEDVAPVAQAGEIVIQSQSGIKVTMTSAGLTLDDGAGGKLVLSGGVGTLTGDLNVTGEVTAGHGTGASVGLLTHNTSGVTPGTGQSGAPVPNT